MSTDDARDGRRRLSGTARDVLSLIAEGRSYDRILGQLPDLTYKDIFRSAEEALEVMRSHEDARPATLDQIRCEHPRAYEKWTEQEDDTLRRLSAEGWPVKEIAAELQRQPSAVTSRLAKLGLSASRPVRPRG